MSISATELVSLRDLGRCRGYFVLPAVSVGKVDVEQRDRGEVVFTGTPAAVHKFLRGRPVVFAPAGDPS